MAKTVLITGGSGGIGSACALKFASLGYSVAIHYYQNKERAQEVKAAIHQMGQDAEIFQADLSQPGDARRLFQEVMRFFTHLDVLVCSAGIAQIKLISDVTDENWRELIDLNLGGVFYCCREAAAIMVRQKQGRIVTVSSIWGNAGGSMETHYSASKAGIMGFTRSLARELALSGVTVNCVAPGAIDTPMCDDLGEATWNAIIEMTPLARQGKPSDVTGPVAFFASDEASFITGQTLTVDGGFTL